MVEIPRHLLVRRWVHSHEEDTDTEMVFRPDDYEFPPSRGRVALELRDDGTALERGIGPTDVPQEEERAWTVEPDGAIVLVDKDTGQELRRLSVESADPDRLTVRK